MIKHKNITFFSGCRMSSLLKSGNRAVGVKCLSSSNESLYLSAKVVIGSDGRSSEVNKLSQGRFRKTDNQRVALFSYFSSKMIINESHVWSLRQGKEYIGLFPNKKRVLVSWYLPRDEYETKAVTNEQSFNQLIEFIAEQGFQVGERLESVMVVKDSSPQITSNSLKSLAFI